MFSAQSISRHSSQAAAGGKYLAAPARGRQTAHLSVSNQAMQQMLQAKLTVNAPGDEFEQEADRVADTVMRMPDSAPRLDGGISKSGSGVQRACACGSSAGMEGQCEECQKQALKLQRSARGPSAPRPAPAAVQHVVNSPGKPLEPAARGFMEPRFGRDFSQVRVHTDAAAAASARAVNARAYTVGHHVAFDSGEYSPASHAGRHLLAHELSHVVQQEGAQEHKYLQRACGKTEVDDAITKTDPEDCPILIFGAGFPSGGKRFKFDVNCDTFASGEETKFRSFLKGVPSTSEIDVIGMASSDGNKGFNEELACLRTSAAIQVIKDEHLEQSVKLRGTIGAVAGTAGNPEFRSVVIRVKGGLPPVPSSEPDLSNVFLILGDKPNVVRQEPDNASLKGLAIQVTLDKFFIALGTADIAGGPDCGKFQLGFFQICRPFDTTRAIYKAGTTVLADDRSEEIRKQEPALDVFNVGDVWTYKTPTNCANPGVLRTTEVLFQDRPSVGFALLRSADRYLAGLAWHDFFFTAFSVQRPDGSVHHLKSFYWNIDYCESFAEPTGSDTLGKSTMQKSDVKLGPVIDGAPKEPGLDLAGKAATTTCNKIAKGTKANMQVISSADISGSC
jgi:hypothetical protein